MEVDLYNDKRYSNVESSSAGQQFVTPVQTHVQTDAPRQRVGQQKPRSAPRMPKAQAQALSRNLKKATTVASILGFGAFSGLIAYHQVNAATTTTTQSSTKASQSNSNSGSFFKQGKESNVGSSSTSQSSKSASTSNSNGSTQSTTSGASNSTTAPATGTSAS